MDIDKMKVTFKKLRVKKKCYKYILMPRDDENIRMHSRCIGRWLRMPRARIQGIKQAFNNNNNNIIKNNLSLSLAAIRWYKLLVFLLGLVDGRQRCDDDRQQHHHQLQQQLSYMYAARAIIHLHSTIEKEMTIMQVEKGQTECGH